MFRVESRSFSFTTPLTHPMLGQLLESRGFEVVARGAFRAEDDDKRHRIAVSSYFEAGQELEHGWQQLSQSVAVLNYCDHLWQKKIDCSAVCQATGELFVNLYNYRTASSLQTTFMNV